MMLRARETPVSIVGNSTIRFVLDTSLQSLLEDEVLDHLPLDEEVDYAVQADLEMFLGNHLTVQ